MARTLAEQSPHVKFITQSIVKRLARCESDAYSPANFSRRILMTSQMRPARLLPPRVLLLAAIISLLPAASTTMRAANGGAAPAPNYELASQWTTGKINKLVFDTGVTPHWLETSDRFWRSE